MTCSPPSCRTAVSTMRSPKSLAVTSPLQATARPPSFSVRAMVSLAGASSRSLTTTAAPSRASRSATCWPMPCPEPVTTATLPSSCPMSSPPVTPPPQYARFGAVLHWLRMLRSPAMSDDLVYSSAARLAALISTRQLSPVELVQAYLDRIDRLDGRLRAYITVTRETALAMARMAEAAVLRGLPLGPLHGVTFAVKDQFDTRGVRTTAGSRLLADNVPDADATVVSRLSAA